VTLIKGTLHESSTARPTMAVPLAISNASWYILGAIALLYGIRWRRNRSTLPLPPGPKKLPFVGNLFDLPSERQWEAYLKWSKEFSALVSHLWYFHRLSLRFGYHPCGCCGHIYRRLVFDESNQGPLRNTVLTVFRQVRRILQFTITAFVLTA
jgi:hypothetical protein